LSIARETLLACTQQVYREDEYLKKSYVPTFDSVFQVYLMRGSTDEGIAKNARNLI
jgi:hypothetical protein